uniref:Uncharacterized protein n=1 Tax=Sphaerodactylus townsendi TaxID=933632 RepID=A0ACB8EBU6_9SAUR
MSAAWAEQQGTMLCSCCSGFPGEIELATDGNRDLGGWNELRRPDYRVLELRILVPSSSIYSIYKNRQQPISFSPPPAPGLSLVLKLQWGVASQFVWCMLGVAVLTHCSFCMHVLLAIVGAAESGPVAESSSHPAPSGC